MISVIIPAKDESKLIEDTLHQVFRYFHFNAFKPEEFEVIVVNDGSNDDTLFKLENFLSQNPQLKDNLTIISNSINRGKGCSIRRGLLCAKGNLFLTLDSDLSTPIAELSRLIMHIEENDLILGSRYLKSSLIKKHQLILRRIYGRVFNFLVQNIFNVSFEDTQNGFKLYNRKAREVILSHSKLNGFSSDVEHIVICNENNLKVKEVGITWNDNKPQQASNNQVFNMLIGLFRIKSNQRAGIYREKEEESKEKSKEENKS